jgi:hypothetical protein
MEERISGWKGFAAIMLVIVGGLNIFNGLVAITQTNYIRRQTGGMLPITNNVKTWGWVAVILGVVVLLAGLAVLSGAMWARVIGVLVAGANLIFQFGFLGGYPLWSFTMIVIDILIIYGLVAHGGKEYDTV